MKTIDDYSGPELFAGMALEYFHLKFKTENAQKVITKHDYPLLLREFALAGGLPEGLTDEDCLTRLLTLDESDFKKAEDEFVLKTWTLTSCPRKDLVLDSNNSPGVFYFYIEELRRKSFIEGIIMKFVRDNEEGKPSRRFGESEEACINRMIEDSKKNGYAWLEQDNTQWREGLKGRKEEKWFKPDCGREDPESKRKEGWLKKFPERIHGNEDEENDC